MKPLIFIFLLLFLVPRGGEAAALDLYAGVAPVEDQSATARRAAMPDTLAQVLGKLSGLETFDGRPEVTAVLARAPSLAVTFYYRNQPVMLPDGSTENELELVVHFARDAVDDLVRGLKLPLWKPERRPLTLWVLVEDDLGRRALPIEYEYAWRRMARAASNRGLAVSFPEPDPDGAYPVDLQLLWGGFTEELSAEGPADALVVSALREGPEWALRMNLDYGAERWTWRDRGVDLSGLLAAATHRAVSEIAAAGTISAADIGRQTHDIVVGGIRSSRDYARCLRYLESLSLVESVDVRSARPGQIHLSLGLSALPSYLERTLKQDGVLVSEAAANTYRLVTDEPAGVGPDGEAVDSPVTRDGAGLTSPDDAGGAVPAPDPAGYPTRDTPVRSP